jgi:hypothetical protein
MKCFVSRDCLLAWTLKESLERLTMRDKASKIPPHDAMPCGTLLVVKLSMKSVLACPPQ